MIVVHNSTRTFNKPVQNTNAISNLIIRVHVVIQNRLGYGISVHHNVSPLIQVVEFEQNVDFTDRVCTHLFIQNAIGKFLYEQILLIMTIP